MYGLKKLLPDGAIVLPWVFIKGIPRSKRGLKNAYPYAYTREQHKVLDELFKVRGQCQKLYRGGAGFFKGMKCDAGRGFMVMTWTGHVGRYYTTRDGVGSLGSFVDETVKINDAPVVCPVKFCTTSFWGMWFGVNPWDYVPKSKREDAYYCRFGPEWR